MIVKEKTIFKCMWCWWCCHSFNGTPLMLPYKYDDRRNKFYTSGNYCSWSCIKSYAIDKYGCTTGGRICGNVVMMRKKLYNQIGPIKAAPSRFLLKEFGGDMTIESFRENQTRDIGEPKKIETTPVVNNLISIISSTKKMDEIKNASSLSNNTLKLKRNKPLKRNHNNLESALGLIITPKS
jgi:hypothetical protein|tara:strand:+ start:680 stop:1222 length:543 start_codon:yes stop_codon:yes gene_type:complete